MKQMHRKATCPNPPSLFLGRLLPCFNPCMIFGTYITPMTDKQMLDISSIPSGVLT